MASAVALVCRGVVTRVLVVAEQSERREALARDLRRAGHEVAGTTSGDGVMAETRRTVDGPDIFVVDAGGGHTGAAATARASTGGG
ncbi:MAG TPA: hypothetical protein QGI71_02830 [Dehalococcoidia bacterium]|nr:hypothetical protein [Dehalococcoidia bacterium]